MSAVPTSPRASGSSTRCSCSTPSATPSRTTTTRRRRARNATSPAPGSTRPRCAPPPRSSERRHEKRQRHADAVRTNLGLGHDLRAGLIDPSPAQLQALKAVVCHLLARDYRDVIAYGAGWTDPERQRPVGESARYEPMAGDALAAAARDRALSEPPPLRGIAALVPRCAAAFVLDPDGVTRSKVLGSERMSRKLHDALPGGEVPLRAALWTFLRPMLSPRLAQLHRDAFVIDDAERSTVDLAAHRGDCSLDDVDLDVNDSGDRASSPA